MGNAIEPVGRASELAALSEALDAARAGRLSTLLVGGDAGVGKTTLVDAFVGGLSDDQVDVVVGECLQLADGTLPFGPVMEVLRRLERQHGVDHLRRVVGPGATELASLLPSLRLAGGTTGGDDASRVRMFEAVRTLLAGVSGERPLVLVLEDVHWADASTRELLVYLTHGLRDDEVLILATYRTDELHRRHPLRGVLGELGRYHHADTLLVEPLGRDELGLLLETRLGAPPDGEALDAITARSEGNPFFALELARSDLGAAPGDLPGSLLDLLLAGFADLPDDTQRALRTVAAAGRSAHHDLVARTLGLTSEQVDDALRPAVQRGFVRGDGASFAFRHALLADAVYSTLLPGELERVHRALAEVLEERPELATGAPAAERAHHWSLARDQRRAFAAALEAAEESERLRAYLEASTHLATVLGLWEAVPDAPSIAGRDLLGVLRHAARIAWSAGDVGRAVDTVTRALQLVADDDADARGLLLAERARYRSARIGDDPTEDRAAALELLPPDSVGRGRVLANEASDAWDTRPREALELAAEALAIARARADRLVEAEALAAMGGALTHVGEMDEARVRYAEARAIAEELGATDLVAMTYIRESATLVRGGLASSGADLALAGLERIRELGLTRLAGPNLAGNATSGLFWSGRWAEAAALHGEISGDSAGVPWLALLQARLFAYRGVFDRARTLLDLAGDTAGFGAPKVASVRIALEVLRGDLDAAHAVVAGRPAVGDSHAGTVNEMVAWCLRAEAERVRGGHTDVDEVRDLVDELRDLLTDERAAGIAHAGPWRLTALAAHARVVADEGEADAWQRALEAWDQLGYRHLRAHTQLRLAEARLRADASADVEALLVDAAETATDLGAAPMLDEIRRIAGRAGLAEAVGGLRSPGAMDADDLGLTARELEVLGLVAEGRTNREIGEALFISQKTASVHVSNILRKLEVRSRTEAAARAHREGILESAGSQAR